MKRLFLFASLVLAWCLHAQPTAVTLTFQTIDDMQAHVITAYQTNVIANVMDTNRGGLFVSSTDALTVDNGIIYTNTAQDRIWCRQFVGRVDPIWFGADPSGQTDSRNSFQAAFNAANIRSVGVKLPKGDFRMCVVPTDAAMVDMHNVQFVGDGGTIWWSLPDWHTVVYQWAATETVNFTNVLLGSGVFTNFSYTTDGNFPWNGKGKMFTNPGLVSGVNIDGGWGTTNAPSSIKPIVGMSLAEGEFAYYRIFYTADGARITDSVFSNIAGSVFVDFTRSDVVGNRFGEYGDHIFYNGSSDQHQNRIANNQVFLSREDIGIDGDTNFVYHTSNAAFKFYNNREQIVQDNRLYGAGDGTALWISMETRGNDTFSTAMTNVVFAGNIVSNLAGGIEIYCERDDDETNDKRIHAIIRNNVIDTKQYCIYGASSSLPIGTTDLLITDNVLSSAYTNSGACIYLHGSYQWTNGLNAVIARNIAKGALSFLWIGENLGDVEISDNDWEPNTTPGSTHTLVRFNYGSTGRPIWWNSMALMNNKVKNTQQLMYMAAIPTYAGGTTYTYDTEEFPDFTNTVFNVVYDGASAVYYNTNTTVGVAPPNAPWEPWTNPNLTISVGNNTMTSYSAIANLFTDQQSSPSGAVRRGYNLVVKEHPENKITSTNSTYSPSTTTGASLLSPSTRGPITFGYDSAVSPHGRYQAAPGSLTVQTNGNVWSTWPGASSTSWRQLDFKQRSSVVTQRTSLDDSTYIVDPTSTTGDFRQNWTAAGSYVTNAPTATVTGNGTLTSATISALTGPPRIVTVVVTHSGTTLTGGATIALTVGGNVFKTWTAGDPPTASDTITGRITGTTSTIIFSAATGGGTINVTHDSIAITTYAGADFLHRHTYTAYTLTPNSSTGPWLEFTAAGTHAANANAKNKVIALTGSAVTATPFLVFTVPTLDNGSDWCLRGRIYALSNTTGKGHIFYQDTYTNYTDSIATTTLTGFTWDAGGYLYIGADADGADSDVTLRESSVEFQE